VCRAPRSPDAPCQTARSPRRWLESWQQSQESWSTADSILHNSSSALELQYFCAQTLRTKVQRDFEELPPDAVIGLRESLVALLFRFSNGAPPVRTQLCLAVAAMAAHLPAQHWDGGSIVRWLMQRCQSVPQDVALPCLLEMLIVLPQEATSHKVAARPERRRQFLLELQQQAPDALQVGTLIVVLQGLLRRSGAGAQQQRAHRNAHCSAAEEGL
jgi:transportin-3